MGRRETAKATVGAGGLHGVAVRGRSDPQAPGMVLRINARGVRCYLAIRRKGRGGGAQRRRQPVLRPEELLDGNDER